MLVIVNAIDSVKKTFLAEQVFYYLNPLDKYKFGEYTVNYRAVPFEVYKDDVLVYRAGGAWESSNVDTLISDHNYSELRSEIENFELSVLRSSDTHCKDYFSDPARDYGMSDVTELIFDQQRFDQILKQYSETEFDNYIISGTFSKFVIDKFVEQLGQPNVKILNIIRNPSVAYVMDQRLSVGITPLDVDTNRNISIRSSVINAVTLKNLPDATTLRFEDIITSGSFEFGGVVIPCQELHINSNNLLTKYEVENTLPSLTITAEEVAQFNTEISDMAAVINLPQSTVPANLFEELGYEPMTLEEIVSSNDNNS